MAFQAGQGAGWPSHRDAAGNALFLILIAVALFAALSFAVTQMRGSGDISREQNDLNAAVAEQCNAYVEQAVNRLTVLHGCAADEVSYELADGTNANASAPSDLSCHVFRSQGAGASPCGIYLGALGCDLTALAIGQKCDNADIVYAGMNGGKRIYTTIADQSSGTSYNMGAYNPPFAFTGASDGNDGMGNTNILVAATDSNAPYAAALLCRGLGAEWYLPAYNELSLLYSARNTGSLNGTFTTSGAWGAGFYWTSTENAGNSAALRIDFQDGSGDSNTDKNQSLRVRCVRSD